MSWKSQLLLRKIRIRKDWAQFLPGSSELCGVAAASVSPGAPPPSPPPLPRWPALPQSTTCPIPVDSQTCNRRVAHFGTYSIFLKIIFVWGIIAFQCGFFYTSTRIRHRCSYAPSHLTTPLGCHGELGSLRYTVNFLVARFVCDNVCVSTAGSSHPRLPLHCPHVCSLCLSLYSCPAKRFISSTIFLNSMYVL